MELTKEKCLRDHTIYSCIISGVHKGTSSIVLISHDSWLSYKPCRVHLAIVIIITLKKICKRHTCNYTQSIGSGITLMWAF